MSIVVCPRCQHDLPPGARFCDHCGARQATGAAPAPAAPPPQDPLEQPAVRTLLQRAEDLKAAGMLGAALDMVQEAAAKAGPDEAWAQLEYAMRSSIARAAVKTGGVGEPLPGTHHDPMALRARLRAPVVAGPAVNPALVAFATATELVRVPSGAFADRRDGQPLDADLDGLRKKGNAAVAALPDLAPRVVCCARRGGRVWIAGERAGGGGHALLLHEADGGYSPVIPSLPAPITSLDLGAEGRRLVVGTAEGEVLLVDAEAGRPAVVGRRFLLRHPVVRGGCALDGERAFAWAGRGQPVLVGAASGSGELAKLDVPHHDVTDVASGAGGRLVLTIDEVGQLCFFRADDGRKVGQVHLPVLQDPELRAGGPDPFHESAVIRPGGNTLHCYEFTYLVVVGDPVAVVRTKPDRLPDRGALAMDAFADYVVHHDEGVVSVYAANMRARRATGTRST